MTTAKPETDTDDTEAIDAAEPKAEPKVSALPKPPTRTAFSPETALFAALIDAQARARSVEKDARNQFHRYNYVSAEQMIHEAKELLAASFLAVVPISSALEGPLFLGGVASTDADWNKNARAAATLVAEWRVIHRQGGSMDIKTHWPVVPEKGRPLDKAVAAARTASLSYLLRDLLQIPRVEEGTDLDGDDRDRDRARPQPPPGPPRNQARSKGFTSVDAPPDGPPDDDEPPPPSPPPDGKQQSTTGILLDFKRACDVCATEAAIEACLEKWKAVLAKLSPRARNIAQGYATVKLSDLAGTKAPAAAEESATQLNELAKE